MSKVLIPLAKYGCSLGLIAYLVFRDWDQFAQTFAREKHWDLLVYSLGFAILANLITFVRWWWLVQAIRLPLALHDAVRLGFLGYLFNFLSLGVVGGDALKAVFLARRFPARRAEAVATVVIDRALGLYALFVVAALGMMFADFDKLSSGIGPDKVLALRRLALVVKLVVVVGGGTALVAFLPFFGVGSQEKGEGATKARGWVGRLFDVVRLYRQRRGLLLAAGFVSLGVHVANTASVYLVAAGLGLDGVSWSHLFVAAPLAMVAGAVPLPGGLGAFEFAFDLLHQALVGTSGLAVALGYRTLTIVVAVLGMGYYLAGRREVTELAHEAELATQES